MADPCPNLDDTRPLEEVLRHDRLCDRFEAAVAAGTPLPIGQLLGEVPEGERPFLFVALVRVAWDCLNPPPTAEELTAEYPQYARLLADAAAGRGPREVWPNLPGYLVEQKIGEGGMGVVYLARREADDRAVAVKVLRVGAMPTAAEALRFERELRAASRFDHPRVVRVIQAGSHAGLAYCVMEYVPGGTLAARIGGRPVDPGWAADLLAAVADGVEYVHSQGVVHRDLKPSNVLLDADDQPLVADFGLARLLDDTGTPLTRTHAVLGTVGYMAPEQAEGRREIDARTDVYALGAILFELLTGRPPFREETFERTRARVVNDDPPRPSDLANGVPMDLEAVCLKCLEKEPASRYESAAAVAADLRRWRAGESVSARPLSDFDMAARWAHRVGYDLVGELARDRWAYTYAAVRRSTGHRVVLVACNTRGGDPARAAFRRLSEALAGVRHANLVRLLDSVDSPPQPYLVLEHADGSPLVRPLPPTVAIDVVSQVAAGLQAIHDRGFLHLGVCHAAVGVTEDGIPRLGGFGAARKVGAPLDDLVADEGVTDRTTSTAPEVLARRWEKVGPAADVYGLGAVLYELLAGRPPFQAATAEATREWVLSTRPPAPLPAHLPAALATLCQDCLAHDPARRPPRPMDVVARLGALADTEDTTISMGGGPRGAGGKFLLRVGRWPTDLGSNLPLPPFRGGGVPPPAGGPFRLRVDRGPTDVGRSFPFQSRRVWVGRLEENDLPLRCEMVSKRHFFIQWEDDLRAFLLTDNASRNGVMVNGRRVAGSCPLAHGDHIRVADYLLTFEAD